MKQRAERFYRSAASDQLVIILHGFKGSPAKMETVRRVVMEACPQADVYVPYLPLARMFARESLSDVAVRLIARITEIWSEQEARSHPYTRITLIAHSSGGVLARRIVVGAYGGSPDLHGDDGQPLASTPWRNKIERLIFLAAVNNGWSTSSAMGWGNHLLFTAGSFVGNVLLNGKATIIEVQRGKPFIAETRLQWLSLINRPPGDRPDLTVIELIGTIDDIVSPEDGVDFDIDRATGGERSFYLMEVPFSGHLNILNMRPPSGAPVPPEYNDDKAGIEAWRGHLLATALTGDRATLASKAVDPDHFGDRQPAREPHVRHVVFVIHGIRDRGFWTQKVARKVRARAGAVSTRTITPTYGYFPMLPFVLPWTRREKVEWLMDRYVEARARFPAAAFSYIGHSNGTYLVARALRDYPSVRFRHIVFAGSVVRCDYDWSALMRSRATGGAGPRVEKVLNYVASGDAVVALFPHGLEPVRLFDVGGAGHIGFREMPGEDRLYQLRFVRGSHAAGIRESQWDEIAEFVATGTPPQPNSPAWTIEFAPRQNRFIRALGLLAPLFVLLLAIGVPVIGLLLASRIPWGELGTSGILAALLVLLGYVWLIRLVATRV